MRLLRQERRADVARGGGVHSVDTLASASSARRMASTVLIRGLGVWPYTIFSSVGMGTPAMAAILGHAGRRSAFSSAITDS